eukprot:SAG31_NODE_18027_length_649_cov_0.969091_1_plen_83_part_10
MLVRPSLCFVHSLVPRAGKTGPAVDLDLLTTSETGKAYRARLRNLGGGGIERDSLIRGGKRTSAPGAPIIQWCLGWLDERGSG